MTPRPHDQALTEREKAAARALAQQVATLLKPALAQIDRKLDAISRKIDDLPARPQPAPGTAPRDCAPEPNEARRPCQR